MNRQINLRSVRRAAASLWTDDAGGVIATEFVMFAGILAVGVAAGLVELRDALNDQFRGIAGAIRSAPVSYSIAPVASPVAQTAGSVYKPVPCD